MRGFTTTKLKNIISLEHCVVRFVMAWCFICIIQTITINSMNIAINKLEYVKLVNMPVVYACIIILTLALYYVFYKLEKRMGYMSRHIEGIMLIVLVLVYACICVFQYNDIYFVAAMAALVSLSIIYYAGYAGINGVTLTRKRYIAVIAGAAALYTCFVSFCMVTRYLSYGSPNFDMGLFSQMFYYMKTTGTMNTTSERDYLYHICVCIYHQCFTLYYLYTCCFHHLSHWK